MAIQIITALLVGGFIGLITNGLAIRMLFRPLKAVYIGKFRLPFTPGLIPKERARLAMAIGDVISRELLDEDTLKSMMLSDSMKSYLFARVDEIAKRCGSTDDTVGTVIGRILPGSDAPDMLESVKRSLVQTAVNRALEQDIGSSIADSAFEELISKARPVFRPIISGILGQVKKPVANRIKMIIEAKSGPAIEKFISGQADEIMDMPLKELIEKHRDKIPHIKAYIWSLYEDITAKGLSGILETLKVSEIIRDRINELELPELEKLIMAIMNKELNAIIWLGGLLGMVMGLLNVLIESL